MAKVRILTGLYRDAYGVEARVVWRGQVRCRRYPFGTPTREMQDWRERTRAELEDDDPKGPPQSFREVARAYLGSSRFDELTDQKGRTRDVQRWIDLLGDTPANQVTVDECQRAIAAWHAEGAAASTINHRIDALVAVLPRMRRRLTREPLPDPVPRVVPRARIIQVLEALTPCGTTTRLWWLYWTGMRPSQLRRLTMAAVDWDARLVQAPSGKAGRPYLVPLSAEAVRQLRPLTSERTFASMSNGSANRFLKAGCVACGVPLFSLYALRRNFGSTLRKAGVDLSDVQSLMGHRRITTTAIYAPVVDERQQAAVRALDVADARGRRELPRMLGE